MILRAACPPSSVPSLRCGYIGHGLGRKELRLLHVGRLSYSKSVINVNVSVVPVLGK